jgi:hypothetical protein
LRTLAGALRGGRTPGLDLGHLAWYGEEEACGPIQRDEALLLHALVRVLRPKVVVELGFHRGHSAANFLLALPPEGKLYSFDVAPEAAAFAEQHFVGVRGFTFRLKSQADLEPADVDGGPIDFILFDAAHDLSLNKATFLRVRPLLSPAAVIAVHDTGTWSRTHMTPSLLEWSLGRSGGWLSTSEFQPWVEERRFVNWLREEHPALAQMHLHTLNTLRHGLTLLQGSLALPTGDDGPARDMGA